MDDVADEVKEQNTMVSVFATNEAVTIFINNTKTLKNSICNICMKVMPLAFLKHHIVTHEFTSKSEMYLFDCYFSEKPDNFTSGKLNLF